MRQESLTHLVHALGLLSSLDRDIMEKTHRLKELALIKGNKTKEVLQ